jgi:hypothetical protein
MRRVASGREVTHASGWPRPLGRQTLLRVRCSAKAAAASFACALLVAAAVAWAQLPRLCTWLRWIDPSCCALQPSWFGPAHRLPGLTACCETSCSAVGTAAFFFAAGCGGTMGNSPARSWFRGWQLAFGLLGGLGRRGGHGGEVAPAWPELRQCLGFPTIPGFPVPHQTRSVHLNQLTVQTDQVSISCLHCRTLWWRLAGADGFGL